MLKMDPLKEIEILIQAYEDSELEIKQFGTEFFKAVRSIVRDKIPAREQRLCVKVPYQKSN